MSDNKCTCFIVDRIMVLFISVDKTIPRVELFGLAAKLRVEDAQNQ